MQINQLVFNLLQENQVSMDDEEVDTDNDDDESIIPLYDH